MLKKGQVFHGRNSKKITENPIDQLCHKCGSTNHFIKFYPLKALEKKRNSSDNEKEPRMISTFPQKKRMTNQEAGFSMKSGKLIKRRI